MSATNTIPLACQVCGEGQVYLLGQLGIARRGERKWQWATYTLAMMLVIQTLAHAAWWWLAR